MTITLGKKTAIFLAVIAVLFLSCCSLVFISQLGKQEPPPFQPTALRPVSTPTAEPTPTEAPTEDPLAVYVSEIMLKAGSCKNAMEAIGDLSTRAGENPRLMSNDTWRTEVRYQLDKIETHCATMGEISPVPDIYQEAHGYLVQADPEYALAAELYWQGVVQANPALIMEAREHLETATGFVTLAAEALPNE